MLSLKSSQEETDTRVILYVNYAMCKDYHFLLVKSPDSDIFFILLYYTASNVDIVILYDNKIVNKQRIIDVSKIAKEFWSSEMYSSDVPSCIQWLLQHQCLPGMGKVKPMKTLLRQEKHIRALEKLGDTRNIPYTLQQTHTQTHTHTRPWKHSDECNRPRQESNTLNFA